MAPGGPAAGHGPLLDLVEQRIGGLSAQARAVVELLALRQPLELGYPRRVADYRTVGDALLAALAAVLGDSFDPPTREAWTARRYRSYSGGSAPRIARSASSRAQAAGSSGDAWWAAVASTRSPTLHHVRFPMLASQWRAHAALRRSSAPGCPS